MFIGQKGKPPLGGTRGIGPIDLPNPRLSLFVYILGLWPFGLQRFFWKIALCGIWAVSCVLFWSRDGEIRAFTALPGTPGTPGTLSICSLGITLGCSCVDSFSLAYSITFMEGG